MMLSTSKVTLKNGEAVDFSILKAPDPEWAPRLMALLGHKGEIWNWQNEQVLNRPLDIEGYYYFLHRDGVGLSNVCTGEYRGVGSFGHVYTTPIDRRKGACAVIMERQMAHFRERGGRFLTLGTGFETTPYQIYKKFGFEGVEAHNGHMFYSATTVPAFMEEYFAPCKPVIEPVAWKHWPGATVLFLSDAPGVIRMSPERVFGRVSTEGPLLRVLRDREGSNPLVRAHALVNPETGAVLGLAVWNWDKLWTGTLIVDVFCHPRFWDHAPALLKALQLVPEDKRHVAYADALCPQKRDALEAVGFKTVAKLANWQRINWAADAFVDVTVLERKV